MTENDSSACWTEVVAAVEFLAQSERLGMTVWDALDEAIRLWAEEWFEQGATRRDVWSDADPLRTSMEVLLRSVASGAIPGGQQLGAVLSAALELWLEGIRLRHNQGRPFSSDAWAASPVELSPAVLPEV
jgi:hypothetical protein